MSLKIEHTAAAQCAPEFLWKAMEKIEEWPRLDPDALKEVQWVSGQPWTVGARFSMSLLKPMPFKMTPEVTAVDPGHKVSFRGEGSGVTVETSYTFRAAGGGSEITGVQELSGGPIMFFGASMQPGLEKGMAKLCARIVEEAEALAKG